MQNIDYMKSWFNKKNNSLSTNNGRSIELQVKAKKKNIQ